MPMIKEFCDIFLAHKDELKQRFIDKRPEGYKDIFKALVELLAKYKTEDAYDFIDPSRITAIDDGNYSGVWVFVVASDSYNPSDYWYCFVPYGSCSGCDTFYAQVTSSYCGDDSEPLTKEEADACVNMALHMVQRLRKMYPEENLWDLPD